MEKSLARITKILGWYHQIPQGYNDIDTLIHNRKQLSIESVKLAMIVGEFKAEFDSTYFKRKISFAKAYDRIKSDPVDKVTDALATQKANIEIEGINDVEKHLEGQFNKGRLILKQVNSVLDSMQQHLSYLKDEKKSITIREKT